MVKVFLPYLLCFLASPFFKQIKKVIYKGLHYVDGILWKTPTSLPPGSLSLSVPFKTDLNNLTNEDKLALAFY